MLSGSSELVSLCLPADCPEAYAAPMDASIGYVVWLRRDSLKDIGSRRYKRRVGGPAASRMFRRTGNLPNPGEVVAVATAVVHAEEEALIRADDLRRDAPVDDVLHAVP